MNGGAHLAREPSTSMRSVVCAALLVLGAVLAPASGGAEIIDRILARVNDEIITKHEVEKATTPYLLQKGMKPSVLEDPERRRAIHDKVLDQLIERELLLAKARELDLSVTSEQVDQWMAMTRKRQGLSKQQFKKLIDRYGMSYAEYRETIRMNLLKIRLVKVQLGRQVSVSDEEIEEIYRKRFGAPDSKAQTKRISLRHILIQPKSDEKSDVQAARKKAERVLGKLKSGTAFQKLARRHSDGPSSKKGGVLGTFTKQELNPAFRKVAWQLGEGEHSGVVRTKFGFHILRVDKIERRGSSNVEKRKRMIRQRLRQKKMQDQLESYVSKLRKQAFVDVKK